MNALGITLLFAMLFSQPGFAADRRAAFAAYTATINGMERQLLVLRGAGGCGFIGGQVAGDMDSSLSGLRQERSDVTAAYQAGDGGGAGVFEKYARSSENDAHEISSNIGMVRMGLSGDNPVCIQSKAAFEELYRLTVRKPALLRRLAN